MTLSSKDLTDRKLLDKIISDLKIIRKGLCSYHQEYGKLCDCKFGVKLEKHGLVERLPQGEAGCGCPELYVAIGYLEEVKKRLVRARSL